MAAIENKNRVVIIGVDGSHSAEHAFDCKGRVGLTVFDSLCCI